MKKIIAFLLTAIGIFSFIIAVIAAFFALTSFIARKNYEPGLMFADVEIFTLSGLVCLWISRRLKKALFLSFSKG
ncbi:MAG TPA: hypothetical protein VLM39_07170 [Ignavibacteriaceae bacterium]|nr:hypothetical protein [Ignavibacteriaceae bacterium]